MLRLIHAQQGQGALYLDDLDDGMPNKQVKRLGSSGDPNAYKRDGYANAAKQPCYIPRTNPTDVAQPGFIDLEETERVTHSAFNGKISGFQRASLLTVVSLVAGDLVAPVITNAEIDLPAVGDLTIDGTSFLSVVPDVTTVSLWGAGVGGSEGAPGVVLTDVQIIAVSPGAVGEIQIIIDTTIMPSLAAGDFVKVRSDAQESNVFTIVT